MRIIATLPAALAGALAAALAPGAASAHPGHLAEAAGHGHWLGAAALGAAIAIGLWQAAKSRKDSGAKADTDTANAEDEAADEADGALQEA